MKKLIQIGLLLIIYSCVTRHDALRNKPFDSLDEVDKFVMSNDSVYGDFIKWVGTNEDSVTWALYMDKNKKFAIKSFFEDKTGFFTKVPGNINVSGQWDQLDNKFRLRFYYGHKGFLDSLKNDMIIKTVDTETLDLDKEAKTIWIMNAECKRNSND